MKYKFRLCQGCGMVMEIELPEEPVNEYLADLGFKKSDKYWHEWCLIEWLNHEE